MIIRHSLATVAVLLSVATTPAFSQPPEPVAPRAQLTTLAEVHEALRGCWQWPSKSETPPGIELTMEVSFKSNGEILGSHITYQSQDVSEQARALYRDALLQSLRRCSPLPLSTSLGEAMAGRPLIIHIRDTQPQPLIDPTL
jgi:hypothetical protein